jgi:hypothetical protein
MIRGRFVILSTLGALLVACQPFVSAVTTTPPMRAGELDLRASTIRISEGVAMAFECRDGSDFGPCSEFSAKSENSAVASVYPAHLDTRDWSGKNPTSFVLAGIRAGGTTVTVRSGNWTKSYEVTVEPVVAKRAP